MIGAVVGLFTDGRRRWRRARNLRAGMRSACVSASLSASVSARTAPGAAQPLAAAPAPLRWLTLASLLLAAGGAVLIALHARWLTAAEAESPAQAADALRAVLPGAAFHVPAEPSVGIVRQGDASLLILSGLHAEAVRHIDLCSQLADPSRPDGRLLPLRIGVRFDDVAQLVTHAEAAQQPLVLRNVVLAADAMPRIEITGQPGTQQAPAPLALRWEGGPAEWLADAGAGTPLSGASARASLLRQGWLSWGGTRALRIARHPSSACPALGELVLQLYRRPGPGDRPAPARALVAAFPAHGDPVEIGLGPGDYQVPREAPPELEDQQLFEVLRARGLVRLNADGLAALAPPDLPAWRALGPTGWDRVAIGDDSRRLLSHLYGRADGDFVREQVRIFNSERRLLAWRLDTDADAAAGGWRAEAGGMPVPLAGDMPAAGARLFAAMPQGWGGWRRVASWPAGGGTARLRLALPSAARLGGHLRLMLAGRLLGVGGARVLERQPACDGRACANPDQVEVLELAPEPGARELVLDAAPLGMDALAAPGDARYRHLVVRDGQLAWQALAPSAARKGASAAAEVELTDRQGALLWHDGAPSEAAREAGLATLLGVRAEQENSVAGMLARLPAAQGRHGARLSIALGLQRVAQAALDCIAMRRGHLEGDACVGGTVPPPGRQAGMVVLDTETGDILAAAGAGNAPVDRSNWREARAFDRIDPATSPLRLPAFQHDGGSWRSPGSTFKIVSSLGLELAARGDPRLDALLDGMPLADINAYAASRGWDFRTEAPTYPEHGRARITNFRDQGLDRHAKDGRLGLAQALTYSLNTWFAWTGELSDRSLFGRPEGGAPDLQPLAGDSLDAVRPIVAMARRLGFGQALRLDGGLLPADYPWSTWDALQTTPAGIDPVHTRHELRQMAIGLRMQATPLQMALAAGAVGQGRIIHPRLLLALDGHPAAAGAGQGEALGVRLDRIRAGMKGVVDIGTAAGAFRAPALAGVRRGLSGKTGTAPVGDGRLATVWFTGFLEPGSLPNQHHRLALAVFVSHSEATGGEHAAPVAAAVLGSEAAARLELIDR
jgi:cell division protein FtsI/penicillin-binding protein 2